MKKNNKSNGFVVFIILYFLAYFLLVIAFNVEAKDLIIYTDDNVYYYQDVDKSHVVVLPNDEIVDAEEILKMEENERPYTTRNGVDIYKMEENRYYIDGEFIEEGDSND